MREHTNNQRGIAHLLLIIILLFLAVAVGLATFAVVQNKDEAEDQTTSTAEDLPTSSSYSNSGSSSLQVNQRNTARKNDSAKLLSASAEYMNNNSGQLPTEYANGAVSGGDGTYPVPVTFEMYKTVTVKSGAQPGVTTDEVVLVTGATCSSDGSAASGPKRGVVALFGLETTSGNFTPKCLES